MNEEADRHAGQVFKLAADYLTGAADAQATNAALSAEFTQIKSTGQMRDVLAAMQSDAYIPNGGPRASFYKTDPNTDATTNVGINPGLFQRGTMSERFIAIDLRTGQVNATFDQHRKYENDKQRFRDSYYKIHGHKPPLDPDDLERTAPQ